MVEIATLAVRSTLAHFLASLDEVPFLSPLSCTVFLKTIHLSSALLLVYSQWAYLLAGADDGGGGSCGGIGGATVLGPKVSRTYSITVPQWRVATTSRKLD